MSNIDVKNAEGQTVKTVELDSRVFGIEPNINVTHQVVVNYLSSLRAGTHSTKGRSDVSGGGKKPWRQKGTGRARQGSIRAAQWKGGGVVFGPTPHKHIKRSNNKEVKLAMRSVLSGKLADGELFVVDNLDFEAPKTKQAKAILEALGLEGKRVTVVLPEDAVNAYLSFRNLPNVRIVDTFGANAHNLIDNSALLLTEETAKYLEGVLA
ncbi:50S ribosomal protein L4 [Olsenella sp. YH-ols2217]|uniref:Large ribosomal subunit protein uL4 n=1 Tax=Kribbibacterium absianum TaxID=3044210 RepID=A0ABT6ZKR8_9ACTN|nr:MULTISPECIES: 50S ribosomal protein L4 [unclassified Olsenella]MDJ1121641.1 50S ribosomal protein L4 [Olsenella sp. YH-ols2216]MDJ1129649.1 50S ribosomal protein L4 [Olsenella sp. YH-ols2217]